MTAYDLTKIAVNPQNNEPFGENGKQETLADLIIMSLNLPGKEQETLTIDELFFRRKLIQKLRKAEGPVELKSKAVELIKKRVLAFFIPGVALQVFEALDGEISDAALEDV